MDAATERDDQPAAPPAAPPAGSRAPPPPRPSTGFETAFRPRGLSLKVRLLTLVLMTVVPSVIAFAVYYISTVQSLLEGEALAKGELAGAFLDEWLDRNPYDPYDLEPLEAEVKRLLAVDTELRHVAVFLRRDASGALEPVASGRALREIEVRREELDAARGEQRVQKAFRETAQGAERFLDITMPLHAKLAEGTRILGAANVEVSLAEQDRRVASLRNGFLGVASAAVALTLAVLILYLQGAIGGPTTALVTAMNRARRGDLDVEAEVDRLDEFGWLAESFNRLVRRVREVDAILKAKVEAATAELARKNAELTRAGERLFETERSVARLERLATLGQLASTIAHEVGTPLNAIYGHIQLMSHDPSLQEKHGERLRVIEGQIERLSATIHGVLSDVRAPEGKRVEVDLNAVLREIAAFTTAAVVARSVKLETALAPDLPFVRADKAQLSQVFMNLLTNALDAMPAGGRLRIETRRASLGAEQAPAVAIEFRDSGVGIAPEDVKRIFEPFYTTKALGQGTGLGLAICHEVVKRHGGQITVSSESGRGTTFVVTLPLEATEAV